MHEALCDSTPLITPASSLNPCLTSTLCSSNIKLLVVPAVSHTEGFKDFMKSSLSPRSSRCYVPWTECISFYLTPAALLRTLSGPCFQEALLDSLLTSPQAAFGFLFFSSLLRCVTLFHNYKFTYLCLTRTQRTEPGV